MDIKNYTNTLKKSNLELAKKIREKNKVGGSTEEAILAMGMAAIDGLDNAKKPLVFK